MSAPPGPPAPSGPPPPGPAAPPGPAEFRGRFPALDQTVHLASCSLGARSIDLVDAVTAMLESMGEYGAPWDRFEQETAAARAGFAALIGAQPDQIAVVPNASVGAYQVASTMDWANRPRILTTAAEFPSLAHVWLAQRARGAQPTFVPDHAAGGPADGYLSTLEDQGGRVRLVSVPLVTYQNGVRLPVAEVAAAAHAAGARVFVDAYQGVGVLPVDVDALGCDYLVAGTLKYLLGLPGLAFLYARAPHAGDLPPQLTGWFGRVEPFAFDPRQLDFPAGARRFETGTPAVPAAYAANAGLGLIGGLDLNAVHQHVTSLIRRATDLLTEQGERLRLPADPGAGGAHLALLDAEPQALAGWLAEHGVAVAPRGDVVRLSFHYYSNADDVDLACQEIRRYRNSAAGRGRRPVG